MQIEVSLEVFKELVARLAYEGQTFSDLIMGLLNAESLTERESVSADDGRGPLHAHYQVQAEKGGFLSRGLWLPPGTQLRARYKRREYRARIDNNAWVDEAGQRRTSPSAAATAITGTSVNGLRFWEALRPGDKLWRRLDALVLP